MKTKTLAIASAFAAFMMVAGPAGAQNAAPDAAAPAATTAASATPTANVKNPYGLEALVANGDWVSHTVLGLLLVMSLGTWYIFVTKYVEQARLMSQAKTTEKKFWTAANLDEGIEKLGKNNVFRNVAERGQSLARAVDEENARLGGGISFLASVGSTAPFVGLFGTVWGILNALTAIGVAGQASIDKVAGPVGEALIMTALGLAVAVPAVLCYNFLVRRNKVLSEKFRSFASDLQTYLLSSKR